MSLSQGYEPRNLALPLSSYAEEEEIPLPTCPLPPSISEKPGPGVMRAVELGPKPHLGKTNRANPGGGNGGGGGCK